MVCSADSNPPASYVWIDLSTNQTTEGADLTIPLNQYGQIEYMCVASNQIYGETYTAEKEFTLDSKFRLFISYKYKLCIE